MVLQTDRENKIREKINPVFFSVLLAVAVLIAMAITRSSTTLILELTAGLIILLISFLSPEAAVYFLIFSMLLSPEIVIAELPQREISVRMDDMLILIIAFSWLARNAVYKELGLFVKTPLNKPILYYVLACVLATALGMVFGKVKPLQGTLFVLKYIEYFLIFFMVVGSIQSREQVKRYFIAMIIAALIISIYAIFQIPSGERISAPFEGKEAEPNTFGGYIILVISMLLGVFFSCKSVKVKAVSLISSVLVSIPLIYTLSRSSWMAAAAMYIALIIFSKRFIPLIALLVIIIISFPLIMPEKVERRYNETFMKQPVDSPEQIKIGDKYLDLSTSERLNSYMKILDDIKNRPVFGYGVTGYGFIDGQFFRTLIETGIVGLTAFIYLLYRVFSTAYGVYMTTNDELFRGLSLGMLAGLSALTAHALSANTFIIVRIMEPFWLVMGMVLAGASLIKTEPLSDSRGMFSRQ